MSDEDDFDDNFDDNVNPSDATILLCEEASKEFKRAFPLRQETEKKLQTRRNRHTPAVVKRLNFDETMSPIIHQMDAEVRFAKASLDSSERKLSMVTSEIDSLKNLAREHEETIASLIDERRELRTKYSNLEFESKKNAMKSAEELNCVQLSRERLRVISEKYYKWFQMANSQLEKVKEFVDRGGNWREEPNILNEINIHPLKVMKEINESFSLDDIEDLANGSIQEYAGVQFNPPSEESVLFPKECVRGDLETTADITNTKDFSVLNESSMAMNTTVQGEHSFMTDGGIANCSIGYEKDDKIQRLLLENSVLKDKLTISRSKCDRSLLLEERNRSLELEKNALKERLDRTFGDIEAMRHGHARKLFDFDDAPGKGNEFGSKYLKLVDRMNNLISENSKLEKDFEAATSKLASVSKSLKECERRNGHLEDVYSAQITKNMDLEKKNEELSKKIEEMETEISELQNKITSHDETITPITDAGNSTQILHMATNPLEVAHAEFQMLESRKRKLEEDQYDNSEAKRKREEEMADLEERLRICEREKNVLEESYTLHKDLASKFRQVCVALTGLQIKLKDAEEGICTVQSEYEGTSDRQFVFKCFYGSTRIDMLDVSCKSSDDMIRKWEPFMKKYIGERNSIPAFLAAVTLQLEKEREFDETLHERTHTFSVLHED